MSAAKTPRERPILFSGPMVRAILDDSKTVTRRIVRVDDTPISAAASNAGRRQRGIPSNAVTVRNLGYLKCDAPKGSATVSSRVACPYGAPGDRLWVRETFSSWEETCATWGDWNEGHTCSAHCRQTYVAYAATPRIGFRPVPDRARITYLDESAPLDRKPRLLGPWRPSIFMPRDLSRITLEIVSVRAERLQDITEEDIRAEGVTRETASEMAGRALAQGFEPRHLWALGWDAINGKRAPWASNPWVWRVEFKRAGGAP